MRRTALAFASVVFAAACGSSPSSHSDSGAALADAGVQADGGGSLEDAGVGRVDGGPGDAGAAPCTVDDQLSTLVEGLLYTSESDYPLEVRALPGEGVAAPTADDVFRLSGLAADATVETRTVDAFFAAVVVDPTRSPPAPDTQPGALRAAVEASLDDLVVVRIIEPAEPAVVHVFLAGRDACGALVWLSSVSIET